MKKKDVLYVQGPKFAQIKIVSQTARKEAPGHTVGCTPLPYKFLRTCRPIVTPCDNKLQGPWDRRKEKLRETTSREMELRAKRSVQGEEKRKGKGNGGKSKLIEFSLTKQILSPYALFWFKTVDHSSQPAPLNPTFSPEYAASGISASFGRSIRR